MKVFIWCICLLSVSFFIQFLKVHGVLLGAIPTFLLYGAALWLIHVLCRKWDEHKEVKCNESNSDRK